MELERFKVEILKMARDSQIPIKYIESFLIEYFKYKLIPHFEMTQSFAVRASLNENGEVFKNTSRCSYNPNVDLIGLQRCNYPNQQVFYCALPTESEFTSASATALVETAWEHIKNNDIGRAYFTVSRWSFKRPLRLFSLPFAKSSILKSPELKKANVQFEKIIKESFQSNPEMSEYIYNSLQFISEVFCEHNEKMLYYRISAAYHNALQEFASWKKMAVDGLLYPSANTEGAGMNLVLKKDLIDNQTVFCDYVVMMSMQRNPTNKKKLSFMPASDFVIPDEAGKFQFSYIA